METVKYVLSVFMVGHLYQKPGILECWNIGILGKTKKARSHLCSSFLSPIIPLFHYSIIPILGSLSDLQSRGQFFQGNSIEDMNSALLDVNDSPGFHLPQGPGERLADCSEFQGQLGFTQIELNLDRALTFP